MERTKASTSSPQKFRPRRNSPPGKIASSEAKRKSPDHREGQPSRKGGFQTQTSDPKAVSEPP